MKKLTGTIGVAALALALGIVAAAAETPSMERKKSFFDNLFSSKKAQAKTQKKKILFKKKNKKKTIFDNWWEDEDNVEIISGGDGQRLKKVPAWDEDVSEGYGMGNLTYVPEKQVALGGDMPRGTRPAGIIEGAIFDAFADVNLGIKVLPAEKQAITAAYEGSGFKPLWVKDGKPTDRALAVLKVFAAADQDGLSPARYLPPQLSDFDAIASFSSDPAALARLDVGLTAAALTYARHASGGQFDPARLSRYNDIKPEFVNPDVAVKVISWSPFVETYLTGLHPQHPAYTMMKQELATLRLQEKPADEPIEVGDGPRVKFGKSDPRVVLLRKRLAQLGYTVPAASLPGAEDVLDQPLSDVVKAFQKAMKIKQTGLLDNPTVRQLAKKADTRKSDQIIANMERLRWLPKQLAPKHVFVNQAAFRVQVFDQGKELWTSRVIVGKPNTQTSVFNDEIEMVVFNPSWGIPPSIMSNEYLPKLRNDPGYLDRIGYQVTNSKGKRVSSSSVDWWAYSGKNLPYSIQQPPGRKNALGELKFLFPNNHHIYMHDTPNRDLFDEEVRAFSHGCVRVQNPREFAEVLLGWDRERIDASTDSKKSQTVKLDSKVPIYITYFTAWPDETGKIQYYSDIYERDRAMEKARSSLVVAQR